jgi:hypothetical protein
MVRVADSRGFGDREMTSTRGNASPYIGVLLL